MAALPQYEWVLALGCVLAFLFGAGLGANDVANTLGSSVGAKALTYKQAIVVGSVMEFAGAVLLGRFVTETVRKGITNVDLFEDEPELFMIGMFCALFGSCIWEILATYWALPIASTHTIIGGIIGFALVARGADGVNWWGVVTLVISWFSSPILAAIVAVVLYWSTRKYVLRHEDSLTRGYKLFPVLILFTLLVNSLFIAIGRGNDRGLEAGSAIGASFVATFLIYIVAMPRIRTICERTSEDDLDTVARFVKSGDLESGESSWEDAEIVKGEAIADESHDASHGSSSDSEEEHSVSHSVDSLEGDVRQKTKATKEDVEMDNLDSDESSEESDEKVTKSSPRALSSFGKKFGSVLDHDIHAFMEHDDKTRSMHQRAERYPAKTERLFSLLQVVTAVFDAFAHGANDLANSIAPVAGIYVVFQTGMVSADSAVPIWLIILGALGMSTGLALYGYKVMSAIGVKLTKITPSRGFSIELGAAIVTIVASRAGIPISTTHLQVGATLGVGMTEENMRESVNWKMFVEVFASWIATVIVSACLSAAIFSLLIFSPCVNPI